MNTNDNNIYNNNNNNQTDSSANRMDGKQIAQDVGDAIQRAISTGNFYNLGPEISNIVNHTIETAGQTISSRFLQQGGNVDRASSVNQTQANGYTNSVTSREGYRNTVTSQYVTRMNEERLRQHQQNTDPRATYIGQSGAFVQTSPSVMAEERKRQLYADLTSEKIGAGIGMVLGFGATFFLGIVTLFFSSVDFWSFKIFAGLLSVLPIGGLIIGILCTKHFGEMWRFGEYVKALGEKGYITVDQLATATTKTNEKVLKDLKKMIAKHWFKKGRLDSTETTLMTDDEAYRQYMEYAQNAARQQQAMIEETERNMGYTPAQREILMQCEAYIKEIRACNDNIPGEVISAKIERLERSARLILEQVKKEPSLTNELHRLMNYYLPTTVKLLNAYAELDRKEKSSANIENSKREIEGAIDALNDGFDKLYDSLFDSQSMDISTDVEVMRTLLEQEGLSGRDFSSQMTMPGTGTDKPN